MFTKGCTAAGLAVWLAVAAGTAGEAELRANARARLEAARKVYQGHQARQKVEVPTPGLKMPPVLGLPFFERLHHWSLRWMDAERELAEKQAGRVAAVAAHLDRMRGLEKEAKKAVFGLAPYEATAVTFYRLEAEKLLLREKK
jgi:hypothetical protein